MVYRVIMEKSGKVLIPTAIRKKLRLEPGTEVLLAADDDGLRVGSRAAVLARIQERMRRFAPDRALSEELIQERRQEVTTPSR